MSEEQQTSEAAVVEETGEQPAEQTEISQPTEETPAAPEQAAESEQPTEEQAATTAESQPAPPDDADKPADAENAEPTVVSDAEAPNEGADDKPPGDTLVTEGEEGAEKPGEEATGGEGEGDGEEQKKEGAEDGKEEGAEESKEGAEENKEGAEEGAEAGTEGAPAGAEGEVTEGKAEVEEPSQDAEATTEEAGDAGQEGEPKPDEDGEQQAEEMGEGEQGEKPEGEEQAEEGTTDEKPSSPIPQSDTFQDGERPETPTVQVTEPLSREGSPTQEPEQIEPGTPERQDSLEAEDDIIEEEEEEALYSREELVEAYQAAVAEREQLQNHNLQLQHKLAEYFKKKKSDDQRQEMDKNVSDQEQRYLKYMSNLEDLRIKEQEEQEYFQIQLEELREKKQEKLDHVEREDNNFTELKRQVALAAISSRTGKAFAPRDVERHILNEHKKEEEVKVVRLENIKLKNRLKKREQQLKAKEELAEGLHLIDFEQLKIENQTYNEKIEERNEELLKLRKKITSTVQVLTHVKEKLQFVQAENQVQKLSLKDVEAFVAQKRDILSRTKKARDALRIDNQRLRQKCGLLGNTALLNDFEERKDEGDKLREKLEKLKRVHAELVLNTAGVKKKIEEARSGRA